MALRPGGALILLWNKELQPSETFHQRSAPLYAELAPQLHRREDRSTQVAILNALEAVLIDPQFFSPPLSGLVDRRFSYSAERYLDLLASYSGYLQLDPEVRSLLLERLHLLIESEWDGQLPLTLLSGWQVARKIDGG